MKTQRWMARVGVVLGITVFALVPTSSTQECPEYAGVMEVEMWSSSPSQVQSSGSYAYLGDPNSVTITDVADLGRPRVVGRVTLRDVIDFSVSGNRLSSISDRIGCYSRDCKPGWAPSLDITDVSDPERPEPLLAGYDVGPSPREIAVSNRAVFIARSDGLMILDVTDPASPVEVGFLASPWEPSDLEVEGGLAYVAVPELGLRIIDVSDPENPVEVGTWAASWEARDLEIVDGFVYVADGAGGLRVIDATDPAAPTEASTLETEGEALNVSVDGSLVTVALTYPGVLIVDVSDPANPKREGLFVTEGPAEDVALTGSTAFALNGGFRPEDVGGFHVLDLSNPESPAELSSFDFRSPAMDIVVSNGVMYVASGDSGLYVLDESNPDDAFEGFVDTPGFALGVTLHNGLALVADDHKGLRIIDVSNLADMIEVGFLDTPGQAHQVAVAGDYAYVADGEGGLRIVDISVPESPVEVGAVATPDSAIDVAVDGELAYVADGHLRVIDVTDPTNPFDDTAEDARESTTVGIEERTLYSASGDHLEIYALWGSSVPSFITSIGLMGSARDIAFSGQHAYVATQLEYESQAVGVEILDILNPNFPTWIGSWSGTGVDPVVAASSGRIYLATGGSEIVILDQGCLTTFWVEIVAHDSGLHSSQWRSDVFISHEAENSVGFDFVLHTVDGEFTAEASVDAGHQGVFEDIVGLLGYEGKGALEIQTSYPITISSRIYNETDAGTYGAFLQGYRSSDCLGAGKLNGLRQVEGEFRTNISVTNTTDETREVWITLYRTDGEELIRYSMEIEAGMVVQDLQPFKNRAAQPNLGWGYATVEGEKGILACASVIDSRTNDSLIVPLSR